MPAGAKFAEDNCSSTADPVRQQGVRQLRVEEGDALPFIDHLDVGEQHRIARLGAQSAVTKDQLFVFGPYRVQIPCLRDDFILTQAYGKRSASKRQGGVAQSEIVDNLSGPLLPIQVRGEPDTGRWVSESLPAQRGVQLSANRTLHVRDGDKYDQPLAVPRGRFAHRANPSHARADELSPVAGEFPLDLAAYLVRGYPAGR